MFCKNNRIIKYRIQLRIDLKIKLLGVRLEVSKFFHYLSDRKGTKQ